MALVAYFPVTQVSTSALLVPQAQSQETHSIKIDQEPLRSHRTARASRKNYCQRWICNKIMQLAQSAR
jgi:hypothetical protein